MSIVYHIIVILTILTLIILIPAGLGASVNNFRDTSFKQDFTTGLAVLSVAVASAVGLVVIFKAFTEVFK